MCLRFPTWLLEIVINKPNDVALLAWFMVAVFKLNHPSRKLLKALFPPRKPKAKKK